MSAYYFISDFKIKIMWVNTILYSIVSILVGIYLYIKWTCYYWQIYGIPYLKDYNFSTNISEKVAESYTYFKTKGCSYGGIFLLSMPSILPVNLELIKNIMQNDFDSFVNRYAYLNEKAEPLTGNLFSLRDKPWRNLRTKLTPLFSAGKI